MLMGHVSVNGQVKFKVNSHVKAKVKVQANVLAMLMLMLMIRFKLRARCVLEFKCPAKLQANIVKVQCEVR